MGTSSIDLLIPLDRSKPRGLRTQIEDELRDAICSGRLAPGATLPSTRALATDLGVTRGVVVDAYDQLIAEGYLASRPGAATTVNAARPNAPASARTTAAAPAIDVDFRPGLPDLAHFPRTAWGRATRAALSTMADADLGYTDARGLPVLRVALADYLARVRGVRADPEQIVITHGFGHGAFLVGNALRDLGHTSAAVEDPGYDGHRETLEIAGLRHQGVPVDSEGMVVEDLRRTATRLAILTPAHQSPTGAVLSPQRRQLLLQWADDVDGYLVEDDYDAEYRYDRRPVGALQGICPDRIVYVGTASKTLAPGTRLGWLVLPSALVEPVGSRRQLVDGSTSTLLQATYAAFLTSGDLDRHLRRMRRLYRERRDAVLAAVDRHLPGATAHGVSAGLQVLVELPGHLDEAAVVARALDAGVRVYPLERYRARRTPLPPAIVLGYGSVPPDRAEEGIRRVGQVLAALRSRPPPSCTRPSGW